MRDNMLKGSSCLSWTDCTQKGFKVAPSQRSQTCRGPLVPQMRQKFGHGPAMVRAGRVRESTDLLQISRVGRDALFQEAWCWLRSEEHTSELQSHSELVCRLLPEKKNHVETMPTHIASLPVAVNTESHAH